MISIGKNQGREIFDLISLTVEESSNRVGNFSVLPPKLPKMNANPEPIMTANPANLAKVKKSAQATANLEL